MEHPSIPVKQQQTSHGKPQVPRPEHNTTYQPQHQDQAVMAEYSSIPQSHNTSYSHIPINPKDMALLPVQCYTPYYVPPHQGTAMVQPSMPQSQITSYPQVPKGPMQMPWPHEKVYKKCSSKSYEQNSMNDNNKLVTYDIAKYVPSTQQNSTDNNYQLGFSNSDNITSSLFQPQMSSNLTKSSREGRYSFILEDVCSRTFEISEFTENFGCVSILGIEANPIKTYNTDATSSRAVVTPFNSSICLTPTETTLKGSSDITETKLQNKQKSISSINKTPTETTTNLEGCSDITETKLQNKQKSVSSINKTPTETTTNLEGCSDITETKLQNKQTSVSSINKKPNILEIDAFIKLYWKIHFCRGLSIDANRETEFQVISQNIWQRYLMHQQSTEVYLKKMAVWKQLQLLLNKKQQESICKLYIIGSTINGISLSNSGIDLCLMFTDIEGRSKNCSSIIQLESFKKQLQNVKNIDNIRLYDAQIPRLSFTVFEDTFNVDVTCNNLVYIANTQLVYSYTKCDCRLKPLHSILKQWTIFKDINNVRKKTLSTHSLTLMIIQFLQCGVSPPVLPCLHEILKDSMKIENIVLCKTQMDIFDSWEIDWTSLNKMSLGELLIGFFKFYSDFKFEKLIVSVRMGKPLIRSHKHESNPNIVLNKFMIIEEPFRQFNTAHSTSSSVAFNNIKIAFAEALERLSKTSNLETIFK